MTKKKLSKKKSCRKRRVTYSKKNKAASNLYVIIKKTGKFFTDQFVSLALGAIFETPIKELLSWLVDLAKEIISWLWLNAII